MPSLGLDEILTKVYDILRQDVRTLAVNWQKARFTLADLRSYPAGTVAFTPGMTLGGETIPSGMGGTMPVLVRLRTVSHEGVAAAEISIHRILSDVVEVLWDKRKLDLTRIMFFNLSLQEMDSNAEASPPYAEASLIVSCRVRM